jgi:hypothetical protein
VTRRAFDELLDEDGVARLAREHGNAPARVLELPATDLTGVSPRHALGARVATLSVADVAATPREEFVERAAEGATGAARSRLRTQAADVWATADRLRRLAADWRPA